MQIHRLIVQQFRNLESKEIEFSPTVNMFVGGNGQGKSNLLEAICLLSYGKSFRFTQSQDFLRLKEGQRSPASHLRGHISRNGLHDQIDLTLKKSSKQFLINEKRVSSTQMAKKFPVVLFSPESLNAIKSGPDQRRQLIDEALVFHKPEALSVLNNFKRALKSRNKLLKTLLKGEINEIDFERTFESLNISYFQFAAELTFQRLQILEKLKPFMQEAVDFMLRGSEKEREHESADYDYLISDEKANTWPAEKINKALQNRARQLSAAEKASGTSLIGPQKHDIRFLYSGNDSRYYCSQGQQRALILAFKMAQIVYHSKAHDFHPLLLLDDVMSELDPTKRQRLVEFLSQVNAQIFMTTTDWENRPSIEGKSLTVFDVDSGRVSQR